MTEKMSITWELCEEYGKEYLMYGYLPWDPIHKYAIKKCWIKDRYIYSLFKRVDDCYLNSNQYLWVSSNPDNLDYCKHLATSDAKGVSLL